MKPDEFEQELSRQPLRPLPGAWRAEILAAAREAQTIRHPPLVIRASRIVHFRQQLSIWFWPHPRAWAGLAALWLAVFALNFSRRDPATMAEAKSSPPSPELVVELRQQQRMLAELIGPAELRAADRQRDPLSKPRSGRAVIVTA